MRVDFNSEGFIRKVIEDLEGINYIRPDDIPNIDLYMDQVTTFMDEKLQSSKRHEDDKLLTKTMINNYTKNKLLPPSDKKKYSKEHMFILIFIYYFKNILSINDIQNIFNPLTDRYFNENDTVSLEDIYSEIFRLEEEQTTSITKDLIRKVNKAKESFPEVKSEEDREFLTNFSFICMMCFDVYMKKQIIEKMIDSSILKSGEKQKKENKESKDSKTADKK